MNPETPSLLDQLADIHGVEQLPWWPPAPGWWLLAALLSVVLWLLMRRLRQQQLIRRRRRRLQDFVEQLSLILDPKEQPRDYLAALNRVFKVVAVRAFPADEVAHLSGAAWAEFLARELGAEAPQPDLKALVEGPYQPRPEYDAQALTALAQQWIQRHG